MPAAPAEQRIGFMAFDLAPRTPYRFYRPPYAAERHLCGDDTGWNGKDAPAQQHHARGDEPAQVSLWRDIAEADRGHRAYTPVHRYRNAREAVLRAFDDVHHAAEDR